MMRFFVFTLLILLHPIHTCASELIPLEVGNYWVFKEKHTGRIEQARVLAKAELDGVVWYQYRELDDRNIFVVSNTNEGQIEFEQSTGQIELVLTYPVTAKTTYNQFGIKTQVTPNVELAVPAGTFNTYQYTFFTETGDSNTQLWVSPVFGPVRLKYDSEEFELVDTNIEK